MPYFANSKPAVVIVPLVHDFRRVCPVQAQHNSNAVTIRKVNVLKIPKATEVVGRGRASTVVSLLGVNQLKAPPFAHK